MGFWNRHVVFPWTGEQDKLRQIFEWRILDLRFERDQTRGPGTWYMNETELKFFACGGVRPNQEGGAKAYRG